MKARLICGAMVFSAILAGCAPSAGAPISALPLREGLASAVGFGQRAEFGGGVAATPLRIVEDSRCPIGVQCVQAGTLRVAVRIEEVGAARQTVLTLEQPVGLAGGAFLTIAAACPYPRHPGAIRPESYRFHFALGASAPAPPLDFVCLRA